MKIRNGFVSNSSSSSFIVIGHAMNKKEVKKLTKENYNNKENYVVFYNDYCECSCLFSVNSKEMWDMIIDAMENPDHDCEFTFYKDADYECDTTKITPECIGKTIYLYGKINDYNPANAEDLKEIFGLNDWNE